MVEVDKAAPPRELVVSATAAPGDSSDGAGSAMAPFALAALSAGLLAKYVAPLAALIPVAIAVVVVLARRTSGKGPFVLRVEDGALEVTRERPGSPSVRVALEDLLDVTLDRQTHHGSARGGSSTERVRLALERAAPAEPIFVPEDRLTPIEAQEWYGRVRVFLRKHGWLPEGERGAPSSQSPGATAT